MKTVIYHKRSLELCGTVANNETVEQVIEKDVIPNFKGNSDEYTSINVTFKHFHLERVNDEVVVIEDAPPETPAPVPSPSDLFGIELSKMKLENFRNLQTINQLGADLTKAKLDIIQIKGGI